MLGLRFVNKSIPNSDECNLNKNCCNNKDSSCENEGGEFTIIDKEFDSESAIENKVSNNNFGFAFNWNKKTEILCRY